jgi:hypothetical protein
MTDAMHVAILSPSFALMSFAVSATRMYSTLAVATSRASGLKVCNAASPVFRWPRPELTVSASSCRWPRAASWHLNGPSSSRRPVLVPKRGISKIERCFECVRQEGSQMSRD